MIIDCLEQQDIKVVKAVTPYQEDGLYWAFVDHNQQLLNLFSFQYDIEIESGELGRPIKLGYISEQAFDVIKKALLTSSVLCYVDEHAEELIYYRFVIEVKNQSDTSIQVVVNFLDEHDNSTPIDDIKIKSAKLPTKQGVARRCEIKNIRDNVYDIHFLDPGEYNLKISGFHKNTKIKTYIPWSI